MFIDLLLVTLLNSLIHSRFMNTFDTLCRMIISFTKGRSCIFPLFLHFFCCLIELGRISRTLLSRIRITYILLLFVIFLTKFIILDCSWFCVGRIFFKSFSFVLLHHCLMFLLLLFLPPPRLLELQFQTHPIMMAWGP